jgi:hypothetical protein
VPLQERIELHYLVVLDLFLKLMVPTHNRLQSDPKLIGDCPLRFILSPQLNESLFRL